jgi:hypothetical protein
MAVYSIQHKVCGHIGAVGNDRAGLEHRVEHLQAAGYYQWRVRLSPSAAELGQLIADEKCDTCRVDPQRGLLLHDATGSCRVCTGGPP